MKTFRDEAGQTLVFTALLMCCLIGFMALAVDVSVLIRAQRRVQTAADAGAIAGGLEYWYHGSTNAATVARAAAKQCGSSTPCPSNGITDAQVAVNIPPTYGWHKGGEYLEVIITQPNPTIFMGTFASLFPGGANTNYNPMNVAARAVAGIVPSVSCVNVTDPTGSSVDLQGGASVYSPGCAWTIDSSSAQALCITGNNAAVSFDSAGVLVPNSQSQKGKCNKPYPGTQTTNKTSGDPLAGTFFFPDPNTVCDSTNTTAATLITSSTTIPSDTPTNPVGGFSTSSNKIPFTVTCFSGTNVTLSGVTLGTNSSSGENHLYLFENGVVLSGNNTIYGTMDVNSGMYCQGSLQGNSCSWNSGGGQPGLAIIAPANGDPDSTGTPTDNNTYAFNGMAFIMPGTNTSSQCQSSYPGPNYNNPYPTIPDACVQMQFGSQSGQVTGMIYAPYAGLYLQDNGGGIGATNLIVGDVVVKSSSLTINANYNYGNPESPLNQVSLVE